MIKRQTESEEPVEPVMKQEIVKRSRVVTDEMKVDEVKESDFVNLVKQKNLHIFKHEDPKNPNLKYLQITL
jgi:hypothetical protein